MVTSYTEISQEEMSPQFGAILAMSKIRKILSLVFSNVCISMLLSMKLEKFCGKGCDVDVTTNTDIMEWLAFNPSQRLRASVADTDLRAQRQ